MQNTLAALLLITSVVVLTSVVVGYAVNIAEQTLGTTNLPQLDHLRNLQSNLLNQTDNVITQIQNGNLTQTSP
jgi:hypothetical protein